MLPKLDTLLKVQEEHKITDSTVSETVNTPFGMDAAERRFQANPKQTIHWIMKRSFADLATVVCSGGTGYQKIPEALHFSLLEAILDNLNDFEWYNDPGPALPRRSLHNHVWTHLYALKRFGKHHIERNERMVELLFNSWRTIVKWLGILTEKSSNDEITVLWQKKSRSECIVVLLPMLVSSLSTKRNLWEEEEVIAFVSNFWARVGHGFKAKAYSSIIMSQCINGALNNLPRVIKFTNWKLHHIMDLAISHLRFATFYVLEEPYLVQLFVLLLRIIVDKADDGVSDLWLDLGGTGALFNVIKCSVLCCKGLSGPGLAKQVNLFKECFRTLGRGMCRCVSLDCIKAVKLALREGLFEVFLLSSPYGDIEIRKDEDNDFRLVFLLFYLPSLLVFPSCVRQTVIATQKLSTAAIEAFAVGHPAYRRACNDLQRRLAYRMASTAYFKLSKHYYRCSNILCHVTGTRYRFRRCGGCEERFYCSEECQRVAWKMQRHRALCEDIHLETVVRDDIRVREYAHITLLAMAEVSRHMPNLRRIAAVEFPYRDFNDLYFAVSFATNPPTLKLETTQMIKKKKKYKHVVEDLLRRVGSYDPSRVALLRIEPLMDLWPDYVDSMYRLVELDKTGSDNSRLTGILEAGKVMGGTRREPCFIGLDKERLEAEYDIIDEIVRRTDEKMAGRPLLCDFTYAAAIEKEVKVLLVELEGSDRKVIYI